MMNPKAKLIPSRSASVTAGTALPARVSVAMTEPGPTRTSAAVPKNSARARCVVEYIFSETPLMSDCCSTMPNEFRKVRPGASICQLAAFNPPPDAPGWPLRLLSLQRQSPMPTIDDVRALAMSLPGTTEARVRGRVKFRVGRIVYLAFSRDETELGFAFPKEQREWLIGGDPEKFMLPPA